jgi:hypothetical protein
VSGTFDNQGQLDISDGRIITCVGKKKSGKSVAGMGIWQSYDGDKIVIDVAGDDGPWGPDVITLRGQVDEIPRRWPEALRREEGQPMALRYVPDAGSATFVEDMDAVVGLAYHHGDTCLLVHEMGVLAQSNRTPPHTRRALMHNRHHTLTLIACAPRPITMDPLVLMQSDLVYAFKLPNEDDRARVAKTIGWPVDGFEASMLAVRGHEYLRFDANEDEPPEGQEDDDRRLLHFDPLPEDYVRQVLRFKQLPQDDPSLLDRIA